MSEILKLISPIDGSVYAQRPVLTRQEAALAVRRGQEAQKNWARRPLKERIALVRLAVAKVGEQNDEIIHYLYEFARRN